MSQKVRAKFRCTSVTKHENAAETVCMSPVTSGSDENKEWSKYTPSGELKMTITAEGAVGVFQPGKSYRIDITEAE